MFQPSLVIKETFQFCFASRGNSLLLEHRITNLSVSDVKVDKFDPCFYIVYVSMVNPALFPERHEKAREEFLSKLTEIVESCY